MSGTKQPIIEWGVAQACYPGLDVSGDSHVAKFIPQGALLAVIDGLGHGSKAAEPAQLATKTLQESEFSDPAFLMQQCHQALQGTRGSVISLGVINTTNDTMTWLGVGNVNGVVVRKENVLDSTRNHLHLRGGVVGYNLPSLKTFNIQLVSNDIVIFVTDGIRSRFFEDVPLDAQPQQIADYLLENYNRKTDDALVLVARYLGKNGDK